MNFSQDHLILESRHENSIFLGAWNWYSFSFWLLRAAKLMSQWNGRSCSKMLFRKVFFKQFLHFLFFWFWALRWFSEISKKTLFEDFPLHRNFGDWELRNLLLDTICFANCPKKSLKIEFPAVKSIGTLTENFWKTEKERFCVNPQKIFLREKHSRNSAQARGDVEVELTELRGGAADF